MGGIYIYIRLRTIYYVLHFLGILFFFAFYTLVAFYSDDHCNKQSVTLFKDFIHETLFTTAML